MTLTIRGGTFVSVPQSIDRQNPLSNAGMSAGDYILRSLATQISDLSLMVFIPLRRLIDPPSIAVAPRVPNHHRGDFNPLEHFEVSQDLMHLETILRIIEGEQLEAEDGRALLTISHHVEALSVYHGSMTDTHWVFDEDKTTLSIWSMLSYYSHCQVRLSQENPQLLKLIKDKICKALIRDAPIFRRIFEYEKKKEQLEYLNIECIDQQVREFYRLTAKERMIEEDGEVDQFALRFYHILNHKECSKLEEIKSHRLLSPDKKKLLAEEVWKVLSEGSSLCEDVYASEEIRSFRQTIDNLRQDLEREKPILKRLTERAELNEVKRGLQGLHEFELLNIGCDATQELLRSQRHDKNTLIQWLVVMRECLKIAVSDQSLNVPARRSVQNFSERIRRIRDYYEHLEKHLLKLNTKSTEEQNRQIEELGKELIEDLKKMGLALQESMGLRRQKLQQILAPRESIAVEDVWTTLVSREAQPNHRLADFREHVSEAYPAIKGFSDRILNKKDDKEEISKLNRSHLFDAFPKHLHAQDLLSKVSDACQQLKEEVQTFSRDRLGQQLQTQIAFRLRIQRLISVASRNLELLMNRLKNQDPKILGYEAIEALYFEARDARNFQTHDLWRFDISGIVNTVYLLAYECPSALSGLRNQQPTDKHGVLRHLVQRLIDRQLSRQILQRAIDEGFDVNTQDYKSRTLLHFLADHPSDDTLGLAEMIIARRGNIHIADHLQMQTLHYAAASGFIKLAKLLVKQGAVVDSPSLWGTPTEIAQRYGYTELAQFLSSRQGVRRSSNAKALLDAVNNFEVSKIRNLIQAGADPSADFEGTLPLVALFDREDMDARKQVYIAHILLRAGANINQQEPGSGKTALHAATENTDNPAVIDFILKRSPKVNIRDHQQNTPLSNAVSCRRENWVSALLQAGALVDMAGMLGRTPLIAACDQPRPSVEIITSLLRHGADAEAGSQQGRVLHYAVGRGNVHAALKVLERPVSPFVLGRVGLYSGKMPYELTQDTDVRGALMQKMRYLFDHLNRGDQEELIALTGHEHSLFLDWIAPTFSESEEERAFLGRLYQRRFCWIA